MDKSLIINDWVFCKFDGIFRIEKIVQEYYDESEELPESKIIGDAFEDRTFIAKGLLDINFEKSIHEKYFRESLVSKLNSEQEETLNNILKSNPDLVAEFERFKIPIANRYRTIQLDVKFPENLEKVNALISFISSGKTFVEIMGQMKYLGIQEFDRSVGYIGKYHLNITNIDFESNNKKRVWREAELISYER